MCWPKNLLKTWAKFKPVTRHLGMGTETRYLIGLGAKLWKTGVSISSDIIGSAVGTGEMKKNTHTFIVAIYTHYLANSLSPELPAVLMCNNIQTFVYYAFLLLQFRSEIALTQRSFSTHNMKALFNYDERTNYSNICLRFRHVAVILRYVFFSILASKDYSRVSSSTTSIPLQRCAFVPP